MFPPRYETRTAIERLNTLLNLPDVGQDWAIILAAPVRLHEFCDLYESGTIDEETRFALMCLIVSSLDDILYEGELRGETAQRTVERVEALLRRDFVLHFHTISYWCLHEETDPDNVFRVTSLLRRIWQDCYKPEYSRWQES
jgi:hypothetical protein